jgi:hypothetical protein
MKRIFGEGGRDKKGDDYTMSNFVILVVKQM